MTKGVLAGPLGSPNQLEGGDSIMQIPGQYARAISIPQTNYGVVVETMPAISKSVAWLATGRPASSVFVPPFWESQTVW